MYFRVLQNHIGSGLYWLQLPLPGGIMREVISDFFLAALPEYMYQDTFYDFRAKLLNFL